LQLNKLGQKGWINDEGDGDYVAKALVEYISKEKTIQKSAFLILNNYPFRTYCHDPKSISYTKT
jgi:hypothetical protein